MTTTVALGEGARVWRADGQAATVTEVGDLGVYAVLDGERLAVGVGMPAWRLALTCDYCDRPASVQLIGGQSDDVLCGTCAHEQFGRPAQWVRPIPRTVIRALYGECQRLG